MFFRCSRSARNTRLFESSLIYEGVRLTTGERKGYEYFGTVDLGYDITAFDMQTGIEPASVLCLGKMWRKAFPARDAENGALWHRKAL